MIAVNKDLIFEKNLVTKFPKADKIMLWTVNERNKLRLLKANPQYEIITDRIEVAREELGMKEEK